MPTPGIGPGLLETTRAFLHHFGSYLFLNRADAIILTTIWRSSSMMGHGLLALRGSISAEIFERYSWITSYWRIASCALVFALCILVPSVRESFAESAIGHIAYMLVRFGPVFMLGSIYVHPDKDEYIKLTDSQRLTKIFLWRYPWLSFELFLLLSFSAYLLALRLFMPQPVYTY